MPEKDLMQQVKTVLDNMSDDEKAKKAKSLKKLMEQELNRRKLEAARKKKK